MITDVAIYGIKEISRGNSFIDVYWENNEGEFGHIWLYSSIGEELHIDSEYMGKEFVKEVFNKLIDDATLKE